MNVELGQQVKIVDSAHPQVVLFTAHVSWVYKNGGFIAQYGANEIWFSRSGIHFNGQKILYAYPMN